MAEAVGCAMADGWYYVDGAARVGPVEAREIDQLIGTGAVGPQTLVWRQGMDQWQPAIDHFDFAAAGNGSGPPPVPPGPQVPGGNGGPGGAHAGAADSAAGGAMTGADGL